MALVNPDMALVSEHKAASADGPVVMLNLMKLKRGADAQRFSAELQEAIAPLAARVGMEPVYRGRAGPEFIGHEDWDFVLLARYPSYEAFCELVEDPTYQGTAGAIREKYLSDARLLFTSPAQP